VREIGAFEKAKVMVEEGWADGRFCGFHGPSELTLLDVGNLQETGREKCTPHK